MALIDRVFFEGIRCFYSRQEVPLAPVTILIGENSSGKSTALALIRVAWDLVHGKDPDFNEEPFLLGAYDQIASGLGQITRWPAFTIGWDFGLGTVTGQFVAHRGQPFLKERISEIPPLYARDENDPEDEDSGGVELGMVDKEGPSLADFSSPADELARHIRRLALRPYGFAPVRTRPLRTYDPIKEAVSPEGDHVPLLLAGAVRSEGWKALAVALESFGQHSGLFTKVDVRQLGTSESDPFQVQIHIGGKAVNLIDVGYGVSQILPILVDCLRGEDGGIYLLQQPEVHLHPRAQAELGSFLAVLAKQQGKRFVVETHSDYLVDRIRMDIRDKKGITADDVALLYFERKNGEATIHRLELDEQGNLLNVPPGYRSFFLEEERRFLGG
jgi:hypothetical protein